MTLETLLFILNRQMPERSEWEVVVKVGGRQLDIVGWNIEAADIPFCGGEVISIETTESLPPPAKVRDSVDPIMNRILRIARPPTDQGGE